MKNKMKVFSTIRVRIDCVGLGEDFIIENKRQ